MELKFNSELIEINSQKIVITTNVLKANFKFGSEHITITPSTKIGDILSLSKVGPLLSFLRNKYQNEMDEIVKEDDLASLSKIMENDEIPWMNWNMPVAKFWGWFYELEDKLVDENNLLKILEILDQESHKETLITFIGVDYLFNFVKSKIYHNLNLVFISSSVENFGLHHHELDYLCYIKKDSSIIDVLDVDKFINYLEFKLATPINIEEIEKYLKGDDNFNSYLITRALR